MTYEEYKKLIEKYNKKEEKKESEEEHCIVCNGSGEGMYDGSTCSSCKGLGVKIREDI